MIYPEERALRLERITVNDLLPDEKVILAETATEQRSELDLWNELRTTSPERMILLNRIANDKIEWSTTETDRQELFLTDLEELNKIFNGQRFLIDITALRHSVWAPLIKFAREQNKQMRVLYVEPKEYKDHPNPSSDSKFDLTKDFESSCPLAGFSQLIGPEDENQCLFITTLGFEGVRPLRLLSSLDPCPTVIPIIGVPGFELEYPTYAVTCNKALLMDAQYQSELRYAKANCPFDIYKVLKEIQKDFRGYYMYIAPVGTKPHALGAILYAIDNPEHTEVLYDHPIGKKGRTEGRTVINIYDINKIK